ncbi:hypothetical protein [Larkinella terrae]|uniref:Uncharacterized protein n=1 Tax=Larkinella terrae TaxID=2025311 RepID=A0A7K0ELG4_9BACT|nr:hypothetical protein [Larkinella terrae]MRS62625.1 hypothetical protein [Larkinella terrae]
MATYKNEGFEPETIQLLKDECKEEGSSFVYVEDEDDDLEVLNSGECVHVQFVGKHKENEVIYDAIIYTLRLHHSSLVYEMAMEKVKKSFPQYVPVEERKPDYRIEPELEEEIELFLTELIEEIEETEAVKVQEHIEIDHDFEYGISLDVCLNVEEITEDVIEDFIDQFNKNTLKLDKTMYSFSNGESEE